MKKHLLKYIVFLIALGFLGCSTRNATNSSQTDSSYESISRVFTERVEYYQGFLNVFQMQATMLNSKVMNAQIEKKNNGFSWEAAKFNDEKRKIEESLRSETVYFLSFFAPERKIDNLDKIGSLWKVYLDVNGRKYEAKVVKFLGSVEELLLYYPYHNKFASAYKLTFPVSSYEVEKQSTKVILTGPIGIETLTFKAL